MSARVTFDRQSDCLEFMRWVERRADEQSAQPVPDEIRNDPSRCCKGLTPAECSSVPEGECERD